MANTGQTGAKRSPEQREADLVRIAHMHLQGRTYKDIAAEIGGLSVVTIHNDINLIKERWREASLVSFDEHVNRELARLDLVEKNYWEGWDRSQRGDQTGDPTFLAGVLKCLGERCRLLGLYAPERNSVELRRVELSPEQRDRRIRELLEKASKPVH